MTVIRNDLQRNFIDDESAQWNNAEDQFIDGTLKMPGHGTGTLSLLAGEKTLIEVCGFNGYVGLNKNIEVVPIRIAKSVVLLKSGALVRALNYVVNELNCNEDTRIHIITMSMGGVASRAWADLVNKAYEQGVFFVSAAGNNYKKLPTRTMVFPARFNRVVAACGVTYDLSPYAKPPGEGSTKIMEGNHGPKSLMTTAIAAFTPNVPWATYKFDHILGIRGDGTSSATPQIAAAAALYYIKYFDNLEALPEKWMRVEAIRRALFISANKTINHQDGNFENDYRKYFGNGILQAEKMLEIEVPSPDVLIKQEEDKVSFPFLKLVFGSKAVDDPDQVEQEMLETELMQLIISDPDIQNILDHEEIALAEMSLDTKKLLASAVLKNHRSSELLKKYMTLIVNQLSL